MLQVFGFETVAVVIGDLYFLDPVQKPGQEGPERGARVEVRFLQRQELPGSVYSAQPILVGRPVWRADLLESVDRPGSWDRTHHHPRFRGWEPGGRSYEEQMTADAPGFLVAQLSDLPALLERAELGDHELAPGEAAEVAAAAPEIAGAATRILDRVRAGELAQPPGDLAAAGARVGWL